MTIEYSWVRQRIRIPARHIPAFVNRPLHHIQVLHRERAGILYQHVVCQLLSIGQESSSEDHQHCPEVAASAVVVEHTKGPIPPWTPSV